MDLSTVKNCILKAESCMKQTLNLRFCLLEYQVLKIKVQRLYENILAWVNLSKKKRESNFKENPLIFSIVRVQVPLSPEVRFLKE